MYYSTMKNSILFLLIMIVFAACLPSNQFLQKYYLPSHNWSYADAKEFHFTIKDTADKHKIFFLIGHTETYLNSNIWLQIFSKNPSGKVDTLDPLEVGLALADGHWLGNRANKIVEHTMDITPNGGTFSFTEKGDYTFTIKQLMRVDPLPNIEYVGLQIDKLTKK